MNSKSDSKSELILKYDAEPGNVICFMVREKYYNLSMHAIMTKDGCWDLSDFIEGFWSR